MRKALIICGERIIGKLVMSIGLARAPRGRCSARSRLGRSRPPYRGGAGAPRRQGPSRQSSRQPFPRIAHFGTLYTVSFHFASFLYSVYLSFCTQAGDLITVTSEYPWYTWDPFKFSLSLSSKEKCSELMVSSNSV